MKIGLVQGRPRKGGDGPGRMMDWPPLEKSKEPVWHLKHLSQLLERMTFGKERCSGMGCMWDSGQREGWLPKGTGLRECTDFLVFLCISHWQQSRSRAQESQVPEKAMVLSLNCRLD